MVAELEQNANVKGSTCEALNVKFYQLYININYINKIYIILDLV